MAQFLFRKLVRVISILVGVTLGTFLLIHSIPGSPWNNFMTTPRAMQGLASDMIFARVLDHRFGFDLPLWRQFTRYVIGDIDQDGAYFCGIICGNFGPSSQQRGRSVQDILFSAPEGRTFWDSRFGYSIRLVLLGSLFVVGLGIPLGILGATMPKATVGRAISFGLAALVSIPNFVLGLLAIIVLASWLHLIKVLPDWDKPVSWIIPAIVLSVMPMASMARVTQSALMNIMHEDYIRTAHAKGMPRSRVMLVHVMRNVLVPIITFLGPTLMEMFAGLFIVENMFALPGFGRQYWEAILSLDYTMILGLTIIYATGIVLVNAVIEVLGAVLDPRILSLKNRGSP